VGQALKEAHEQVEEHTPSGQGQQERDRMKKAS
jgi:hypothetical protein